MENTQTPLLSGPSSSWLKPGRTIAIGVLAVAAALGAAGWWYLRPPALAPSEPVPQSAALDLPVTPPEAAGAEAPPPEPEEAGPVIPAHDNAGISAPIANALAQVTLRLGGLESEFEALKNASGGAADMADAGAVMQLDSAMRSINSSLDSMHSAMTALNARLTALEAVQAAQPMGGEAKRISTALGLRELERALNGSGPYTMELETLNKVLDAPSDPAIAALRQYAAAGVPARPQLLARFDAAAAAIVRADAASGNIPGWAGRAYAFVTSLVMIRPLGEREGMDAPSRVARAQLRLEEGDLDAAIRELSELEGAAVLAAEPWLKDARARQAVEQALAQLNAALTRQLNEAAMPAPVAPALPAGTAGE